VARETIELWTWSLAVDERAAARLAEGLGADEIVRARRFVYAQHRRRYIAAHARLRAILAGYVNEAPAALSFSVGAHGKPALAGPHGGALHFNLSHSGDIAALGVSRVGEIGVDVEMVGGAEEDVARRFFSAAECAALDALPPSERARGFARCWTRKEAVIKAVGEGLSIPLDSFAVSLAPDAPARILHRDGEPDAAERWTMFHFEPAESCMGAVAVPRRQCALVAMNSTPS
jgi:4'-phosphopantetheinyl transferase